MPTATLTPPADLIELRADWLAAKAAHKRACDEANAGPEITVPAAPPVHAVSPVEKWVEKLYVPTGEQLDRRTDTYNQLLELTRAIAAHAWWGTLEPGTRHEAEIAVRGAAQALYDAEHAAAAG